MIKSALWLTYPGLLSELTIIPRPTRTLLAPAVVLPCSTFDSRLSRPQAAALLSPFCFRCSWLFATPSTCRRRSRRPVDTFSVMLLRLAVMLATHAAGAQAFPPPPPPPRPPAPATSTLSAPQTTGPTQPLRTVAIDQRLANDARFSRSRRSSGRRRPPGAGAAGRGDTVVVGAIVSPRADPSEVARDDYRVRFHLTDLLRLTAAGDRVDRFAIRTAGGAATDSALARINGVAFGFRAYRSADVAVGTSKTFQVVSRFHRAIAVITITGRAPFFPLLCILILRVDERRGEIGHSA